MIKIPNFILYSLKVSADVKIAMQCFKIFGGGNWGHSSHLCCNEHAGWMSCTLLRIRLNTICGKPGFNSLKTPLNHGASYTKDASKETLKQHNSVTYRMLPRAGKLHKKNTLQ